MAKQLLPAPPYETPLTDKNGVLTVPWQKWFQAVQALLLRIADEADGREQGSVL